MKLDVWMERSDRPVGLLMRQPDKSMIFVYSDSVRPEDRLSMAMPVREEPYGDAACVAYFGNLLFEGRELDRIMALHQIDRDDIAALLHYLGADCPGAVSVTPEGTGRGKSPGIFPDDYEELDDEALRRIVISLHMNGRLPEGARDPSPIAGVQPKIALLHIEDRFYLPKAGTRAPTTHILKVAPRSNPDLARHEAALLHLAAKLDLETAETSFLSFDGVPGALPIGGLLSRRFDRTFDGKEVRRLHSEDFCQALGIARHLKYERDAAPEGPRFCARSVSDLADKTARPAAFRLRFFEQTLFNLAVGNTDNHAKNGTILYEGPAGELSPLYDVVPVFMERRFTHQFSFLLGGAAFLEDLTMEALEAAMGDLGFARPRLSAKHRKLLATIARDGLEFLHEEGGKSLADAISAQLAVLKESLGLDLGIPERDYYPRSVRDEDVGGGGWDDLG
jgi:serine/threonine-protein kinase HipA